MILPPGTLGDASDMVVTQWAVGRGAVQHPHRVQDGPTLGNDQTPNVSIASRWRNPALCYPFRYLFHLTVEELRPREGEWLVSGHTAGTQWPSCVQSPSACQQLLLLSLGSWDFPGGPEVKTPHSQGRVHRFDPWWRR